MHRGGASPFRRYPESEGLLAPLATAYFAAPTGRDDTATVETQEPRTGTETEDPMRNNSEPKPVIDAINDAIGALSDLLHSLRAHAKASASEFKSTARTVKRDAVKAGKSAVKSGRQTATAVGDGLLERATKAWHDLTGVDEAPKAKAAAGPRRGRKTRRAR
jgi:hypothetical protein